MGASKFLQKKANTRAKEIDKKYGEGQYGGTWWQDMVKNNAEMGESPSESFLQRKMKEINSARTVKPESTQDVVSGSGAQKNKKFDAGQYAEDVGKLFLNGVAEGVAATGAAVENWIGKGLDKLFPGAGFEGSGLFNVLYNGRPDWKWAGENGLVGIKQDREYNQESLQENAERIDGKVMKKAAEFGGDIAYGLGNAAPMAATAMVTGGAPAAAALTKEGLLKTGAEVVEKSGVLNSMSQAARDMLTSRDYWTSFASEVGMDYYDALDSGATEDEALRYALSSAGLNSVIEIGGGIQKIPEKPTFRTWLKSAHEEGMEEIQQGVVSRLLENMVYNKGNPIASVTDENAVLNPVTALGEYAGGAAVGGILSGGQQLTQRGINNAQYKRAYGTSAQDLVKESLEMNPDNALATKLQKKLDAGKKLTGSELRQLVEQNEIDMVDGDRATIQTAAEARLTELGETENVPQVAEAIARQAAGERITDAEKTLLEGSERARQVRQELNPENIRVGATDEEWTGKIGTARVNRAAYNRGIQENGVTGAKYNAETGKLDAIVKDDQGKIQTVPAEKAELSPLQEELFDWAADLGEAGPVLVSAYRQTQNLETYARQFHNAYEYGKAGVPMDYVNKSQAVSYLNTTQREIAYEEGAKAHQRELQGRKEKKRSGGTVENAAQKKPAVSLRGAEVGGVKYAPVNKKAMDGRQWASVGTMKAFAQATGVNVVFYESQANERGEYEGANGFYKNGTLYLDINAGRDRVAMGETAILKTAAHEITHYIKEGSPEQYEVLKNFVVEKLTREKGISFDDLVTDKQRREPGLSYEEAVDEVVADACEMMLKDSKAVEKLARENRSLAERIRQWIRKWVRSLKAAMEGLTADRPESRAMMQYAQELQEIWDNALVDAARNGRGTVTEAQRKEKTPNLGNDNMAFVEDGGWYSVRENFSKEIDSWVKDDMPEGVRFTLGSTGPVMQGLGAIESDIYMEGDKIKKIMQDHPEMTLAEIKKVPQILEDPALILKSEGRGKSGANSRLVCFGLTKAQNGQPVMTVMDLRPRENGFVVDDMQKVNSAYTKNNPMAFIQKSDVVYADKKRAIPLLRTTGLTISSQRLLRNGYIGSISYQGSSVNIEGVPFSSVVKMEANDKVQNSMRDSVKNAKIVRGMQADYWDDQSYRAHRGKSVMSEFGHAMFMDDPGSIEIYGNNRYSVFKEDLTSIDDLKRKFAEQWDRDKERGFLPHQYMEEMSGEEAADNFDPTDIVDSAQAWDNEDMVQWFFAHEDLFENTPGVKTSDGAVVWDENIIYKTDFGEDGVMGSSSHEERLKEEKIPQKENNEKSNEKSNEKAQFSMREPVEETRNLIALHNMTPDNLRGALKLGGLPMPSIAIVKAKSGHDQYGPITLVFRKDTIDPQLFRSNKVYGYDAWTPTAPRIEYEVNEKAADKLRELYYRMRREKGRDFAAPLYSVANTLEDELNNKGGLDKVVDRMRDDTRIMQIYLEDTGAGSVANVMRKNVTRMSEGEIEMAQALTEKLGEKTIQSISAQTGESPFSARRRWFEKYGEAVNDALTAYYEQEGIPHEEALRAVEAETTANKIKSVLLARKYLNGNAEVITEEVDREATDKAIREKVNQDSYDQWLEGLFSGVVKNSGIYNGKDYYTASGNRRSFSATHYEVNLENTVRAMKQGDQTGVGTFFGGQAIWGVTAKDYRSIEEIKEDSGRLQKLSEEEYSQIRQQFTERLANITSEIMDKNNGNEFAASDDAASAIVETLRTKHTVKAIDKELRTYPTLRIQPDTAQKVFDLCRDISNMPTGYFEAKPQRAVGFDEAAAVVVPDNLPADLRKGLEQIGATVREYKAGDEQSRLEAVNADERVLFQQREPRLSDRAVLEWAAEMALRDKNKSWTAKDREQLERFRNRMRMLQDTQEELEALKEERKVLLAGRKVSEIKGEERTEVSKNKNRIDIAKNKAERYEAAVWELESKAAIKTLLEKSRSIVETEASYQARKEYRERQEEREMVNVTRRKVERNAKRLLEYMNTNTDKKHIPEALKKPIGELLESLNFFSNSARRGGYTSRADLKYYEAMQGLQAALATQRAFDDTGEGTDVFKGYLDLPAGFESLLAVHVERVKNVVEKHPLKTDVLKMMDLGDLRDLDVILSVMSRSVTKMNEMFIKRRFAYVADAAEDSIFAMQRLGQHQDKPGERFALWDNTLPWYAFQRFGEGGKAVFEGLQDGWDKLAFNMKTILDFKQGLISDAQARKWDTETHKVELTDPDGSKVTATLTTAQLMSLYCLSKRKQALGHLLGGGIRPDAIEVTNTLGDKIKKKKWNQDKQFKLTEESLGQLLKLLTPEQIKVADAMQKFMTEQGSAWGNAISMERFGYRAFTEQNYFPIETDRQDREAKTGDAKEGSLYRLQNISAVKPLVKNANNALILRGIFDVFANHTADMAKYNAMVLPIIDAQKWYNYRYGEKNEAGQVNTRTVQRAMTKAYGEVANNFVIKYLQDLNGVKENGDRGDTIPKRMISNYKRAMVAANMRVALLQPTAYARASAVLDYKYLLKAFKDKTGTKQATKEMMENSGIALWKSLGFFDTDVGRSIRDQIKSKSSKIDDLVDKTMVPAEKGDEVTWARLWRACKLEVQDKQHLTGEELLNATAERFREVIYRTQVVDSTMTRSHAMRGSGTLTKMATSFMSEPTVSYNMVMESTRQIAEDAKRMGLRTAIRRNWKTAGRSYQAYIVSAIVTAIVESLYDALRDSDDDKYLDKVWKALGGEKPETVKDGILDVIFGLNGNLAGDINPIGKVPYLRDVVSILGGYSNGRMDTEAVANLKKAIDIWDEVIRLQTGDLDKATKTTYYGNMTTYGMIYPTAKALSQLTGLPGSAAMREVATAWNTTVGTVWPALKMRTYEDKKLRKAWENYGKDSGVSYAVMYRAIQDLKEIESDRDADGNAISGSLKAKYVEYIRGMGLTRAQEKAVWEAAKNSSWSDKGTPWG